MQRTKAVSKLAPTVEAEASTPHSPPAEKGETPWHLKPSVGTWCLAPVSIGALKEQSDTDGQTGQIQPASDTCEPESAVAEELSFDKSNDAGRVSAGHEAQEAGEVCEAEPYGAASGVAKQTFGQQPSSEKDSDHTQVAPETSASATKEIWPLEAAEESLVREKIERASRAEPTTATLQ